MGAVWRHGTITGTAALSTAAAAAAAATITPTAAASSIRGTGAGARAVRGTATGVTTATTIAAAAAEQEQEEQEQERMPFHYERERRGNYRGSNNSDNNLFVDEDYNDYDSTRQTVVPLFSLFDNDDDDDDHYLFLLLFPLLVLKFEIIIEKSSDIAAAVLLNVLQSFLVDKDKKLYDKIYNIFFHNNDTIPIIDINPIPLQQIQNIVFSLVISKLIVMILLQTTTLITEITKTKLNNTKNRYRLATQT